MRTKSRILVSVVITTYNRRELLRKCLAALRVQTFPHDRFEIIVVDDGSTDGTEELMRDVVKRSGGWLRYFHQENSGLAAARNLGISKTRGTIVAFLDDDCIPTRNWVYEISRMYEDPRVAGTGGTIRAVPPKTLVSTYLAHIRLNETPGMSGEKVIFLIGGNASYRRDVLALMKGFDELFVFNAGEDVDLGLRLTKQGFMLRYNPDAIVYHNHKQTLRGFLKTFYSYGKGTSLYMIRNGQRGVLWTNPKVFVLFGFLKTPFMIWSYYRKGLGIRKSFTYPLLDYLRYFTLFMGKVVAYQRYKLLKPHG